MSQGNWNNSGQAPSQPPRQESPSPIAPQPAPKRLRRAWILVPLACLFTLWIVDGVNVGFEWEDVMRAADVHDTARYTALCIMGVVAVSVAAIIRIARRRDR